jgi:pimeloyl-ACP methyl ester carboxylesterase
MEEGLVRVFRPVKLFFICSALFAVLNCCAYAEDLDALDSMAKVKIGEYNVRTKDGWNLSVNRYTLKDDSLKKKAAVILCHGFNINNKFWDLDRRCSIARYLASNGYDVWAPSLRGSGLSSKPILSDLKGMARFEIQAIPRMLIKAPADIMKFDWNIDDHIHKDVPAIIDLVRRESGFDKVYWIGHSMGSIIVFGYLETEDLNHVAGFISLSTMMIIEKPLNPHLEVAAHERQLLTASLLFNAAVAAQIRNYSLGTIKIPIEELLMNKDNMERDVIYRFFRVVIEDASPGIMTQFANSLEAGKMVSSDGKFNYTDSMGLVKVPMLVAGGSADGFVTEKGLGDTYEAVSSGDKSLVIFSKANGYSVDYGHCDIILGKNSQKEVYPVILKWLDERAIGKR